MFSVRKVKTKSGSTAVQVVRYAGHKSIIIKHIGSSKDDTEIAVLMNSAANWIEEYSAQLPLFPDQKQKLLVVDRGECVGVTHNFAAHVLICFVALMGEKYLELTTRLSLREIRYLTWDITETQIQDNLTKEIFSFRSPTKVILAKLSALISKWNLLPH